MIPIRWGKRVFWWFGGFDDRYKFILVWKTWEAHRLEAQPQCKWESITSFSKILLFSALMSENISRSAWEWNNCNTKDGRIVSNNGKNTQLTIFFSLKSQNSQKVGFAHPSETYKYYLLYIDLLWKILLSHQRGDSSSKRKESSLPRNRNMAFAVQNNQSRAYCKGIKRVAWRCPS